MATQAKCQYGYGQHLSVHNMFFSAILDGEEQIRPMPGSLKIKEGVAANGTKKKLLLPSHHWETQGELSVAA